MAECGLTSGSDKELSEAELIRRLEEKEGKQTPQINFMYNGQRMQSKQSSWARTLSIWVSPEIRKGQAASPPSNIGIHLWSHSVRTYPHK